MSVFDVFDKVRPQIRYSYWASAGHGQNLEELAAKMVELGNSVLETDAERQRLLVGRFDETQEPRWGCRLCLEDQSIVLLDSEDELTAHVALSHPEWSP